MRRTSPAVIEATGSISPNIALGGGPLVLSPSSGTVAGNISVAGNATLENLSSSPLTLSGNVATNSHILTFNDSNSETASGIISGGGSIVDTGGGSLTLSGANTYSGGTTLSSSTLIVANTSGSAVGTVSLTVPSGSTLAGSGKITGAVTISSGGIIAPGSGSTPGIINTGNLTLSSGSNLDCVINGSTAGTGYSQVNVTGTATVSGAYLNLTGSRTSYDGDVLMLIKNDASDAITGTFSGLSGGSSQTVHSVTYILSYVGGTGNDFTITDYTPPVPDGDSYDAVENTTLNVNAASGVLNNDSGHTLSVYSIDGQTSYIGTQITNYKEHDFGDPNQGYGETP